jgi:CHASE2 domain-containing sensor protein
MTNEAVDGQEKIGTMEGFNSLFEILIALGIIGFVLASVVSSYLKWGWPGLVFSFGAMSIVGMLGAKYTKVDKCEDDG